MLSSQLVKYLSDITSKNISKNQSKATEIQHSSLSEHHATEILDIDVMINSIKSKELFQGKNCQIKPIIRTLKSKNCPKKEVSANKSTPKEANSTEKVVNEDDTPIETLDIDVSINEAKDTNPSNFEEYIAVHSTRESDNGTSMTKEEAVMWENGSHTQQKKYCIAAHSKANEVLDINATINERIAME